MSARVVIKRGAVRAEPISWPVARESSPSNGESAGEFTDPYLHGEHGNHQNVAIASVKRELAEVRGTADHRIEEAYGRGRAEGEAALRQALNQQFEIEIARVARLMEKLVASGPKLRQRAEEDMVRLAVAIARRVINREITIDGDVMLGLVKAAFSRIDQREVVQIRTDAGSMTAVQRIIQTLDPGRRINLVVDAALQPGSLLLESSRGQLDASVDTQLDEIQRGFTDFVNQKH